MTSLVMRLSTPQFANASWQYLCKELHPVADGRPDFQLAIKMPQSCKDIRAALAFCLQNSDCIMIERNSPGDCLRPPLKYTLPTQCQQLQKGYAECKRGMIDMRKRFRGNRPIAVQAQIETGAHGKGRAEADEKEGTIEEKGYMLYAGRPYKGVKETSGNEDPDGKGLER